MNKAEEFLEMYVPDKERKEGDIAPANPDRQQEIFRREKALEKEANQADVVVMMAQPTTVSS